MKKTNEMPILSSTEEPPATTPAAESDISNMPTTSDIRTLRIEHYLADVLSNDSPLAANIGAVNSDLMHAQHFLRQAMNNTLTGVTPSLEELQIVMPGLESMVKLCKQIDRLTQLTLRLKAAEVEAERLKESFDTEWNPCAS